MATEIEELVKLLENVKLQNDVKQKGWEYILGLTTTNEGLDCLLSQRFIYFILSCLRKNHNEDQSLSLMYKCVINISSNKEGAHILLSSKKDLISDLLLNIQTTSSSHIELICYIVNNLSCHSTLGEDEISNFPLNQLESLTKLFILKDMTLREKYRFLGLLFANITKHAIGRRYFLQQNKYLADFFTVCANPSESMIRRLGASLVIRNCCFETDSHQKLLKELNILPNLLLPLMGNEDYKEEEMEKMPIDCQYLESDKKREENSKVRKTLVQSLCLLCYTEYGWNFLKDNGVYYVTRELHTWEKDETVIEAIETLLIYLLVENYSAPNFESKEAMLKAEMVVPLETDVIKDLPDFII